MCDLLTTNECHLGRCLSSSRKKAQLQRLAPNYNNSLRHFCTYLRAQTPSLICYWVKFFGKRVAIQLSLTEYSIYERVHIDQSFANISGYKCLFKDLSENF